jgi:predicted peptidase
MNRTLLGCVAVLLVIGSSNRLDAQTRTARIERKTLPLSDGQVLLYGLSVPGDYDPKQARPLVLALHPGGDTNPFRGAAYMQGIFLPGLSELQPIMIAPDCPTRAWSDPDADAAVMKLIQHVRSEYTVDPHRILVVGYSFGGQGTWFMEAHHSDLFTAAIVMAGRTNEPLESLARIPTYIIHSRQDQVIPFQQADERAAALIKIGRPVKFEALDGFSHFEMGAYVPALQQAGSWVIERWKQ